MEITCPPYALDGPWIGIPQDRKIQPHVVEVLGVAGVRMVREGRCLYSYPDVIDITDVIVIQTNLNGHIVFHVTATADDADAEVVTLPDLEGGCQILVQLDLRERKQPCGLISITIVNMAVVFGRDAQEHAGQLAPGVPATFVIP